MNTDIQQFSNFIGRLPESQKKDNIVRFKLAAEDVTRVFSAAETPVLVYQMGKVGSSTVCQSITDASNNMEPLHLHHLSANLDRMIETHIKLSTGPLPMHLFHGWHVREMLRLPKRRFCKVITLVRDPVARQVSNLFEVPEIASRLKLHRKSLANTELVVRYLLEHIQDPSFFEYVFTWFERELCAVFGIDIFARPFNRIRGSSLISGKDAEILILRLEDLGKSGKRRIRDFLDLPANFQLANANETADENYHEVLKRTRLEAAFLNQVYAHPFVQHFYAPHQIAVFKKKWSKVVN